MADVNAIINIDINSSSALTNLKRLESQIDQFNRSVSTSNATAAASQQSLNRALLDGINNTGLFTSKIVPVESSMTRFSRSIDEGRLSLGEYTRYASSQLPGLSKVFKKEFDSIEQVATSRVKSMQTQYLALGKTVDGVTRTIASTPTGLSKGFSTDIAMAQQRQQLFNKLLDDGSTKLLNFGKNTQWAGRQLMVGFSLPLAAFGAVAAKTFMEIDKATISLKRVYGDLSTTKQELDSNVQAVKGLGKEYTKYGITLAETIALSGRAAATGATNEKLMAATEQTLRFATLGQMDYNQALDTTISLQTAFAISNEDLGKTVDYLNAVENQTILTMEDMSVAIPRVATVVKGLGGSVQDLAVMMTAMREGGVSAENAANGLKSGLASLINPTKRASESLGKMGVNLNSIINQNKGDLMGIVTEFGTAINKLDEFSRQQVLEQVFGKFQYARMSALFTNITKDAGQAARAMDIAGMSAADLAKISEKELGQISESTSVKFQAAMEQLKISIAPIGEAFLKGITPVVNMVSKIAEAFNNLPDGVKNSVAVLTGLVAGLGPVFLMTIGLLGNGLANIVKGFQFFRKTIAGIKGDASAFTYLAQGELEAVTASKALEGSSTMLTDKLLLQRGAVSALTAEYERFSVVAGLAGARMGGMGGGTATNGTRGRPSLPSPRGFATGGIVPGTGNGDTIPALLTPGESVITKKATQKYAPILQQMNDGTLPGFAGGFIGEFKRASSMIGGLRRLGSRSSRMSWEDNPLVNPYGRMERQNPQTSRGSFWKDSTLPQATREAGQRRKEEGRVVGHVYSAQFYQRHGSADGKGSAPRSLGQSLRNLVGGNRLKEGQGYDLLANQYIIFPEKFNKGINKGTATAQDWISSGGIQGYEMISLIKSLRSKGIPEKETMIIANKAAKTINSRISKVNGNIDEKIFGEIVTGSTVQALKTKESKDIFKQLSIPLNSGRVSIGQAIKSWQTSSRSVREDPQMLGALMSGMRPSQSTRTLTRGTTLGLSRGSEFAAADEAIIMQALRSGNVDSLVGREFGMAGPISYTAGNVSGATNAMAMNTDVNRIRELKLQHRRNREKNVDRLKRIERLRRDLDQGRGPIRLKEDQLAELEKYVAMYAPGQKAIGRQIKSLSSKGYENLLIEQRFNRGDQLLDVNAMNPSGTFMGKDVSRESEFISSGSRVRVSGVTTDPETGFIKLILENIADSVQKRALGGPIVPGSGSSDTVPAMLTPGEFVINKKATQSNLPLLHAINNGQTARKNKGGMINGIQYFEDGGGVQSGRRGGYKAPPQIARQTSDMQPWSTQGKEMAAARAAAEALGATTEQIDNNLNRVAAHLVESQGEVKDWVANNLMADLQSVNQYMNRVPKVAQTILSDTQMISQVATQTGLSSDRVRQELDLLVKKVHPSTIEAASVLRHLSELDAQASLAVQQARQSGANVGRKTSFGTNSDTGYLAAMTSATLQERLQGDFYQTLGDRAYVTPEGGYQTYRGGASGTQPLPTSVVEDFKGVVPGPSNQQRKEMRRQAQEDVKNSPVSQYSSKADKKRLENQIFERKVIEETQKERLKLIDDEAAFLKEQGVDHDKAMKIAEKTVDEGKAGIARQKKERRFQNTVVPVGTQSLPILTAEELQQLEFEKKQTEEDDKKAKKNSRRSKIGKGLKGAGGAMGMASMLPFMMQNEEGKFMGMDANMLGMGMMVGGMAAPAIGGAIAAQGGLGAAAAAAAPIAAFLLPLAAGAIALKIYSDKVNDASRAAADMGANLGVTANSLNKIGGILGASTPAQRRQQTSLNLSDKELSQSFGEFSSILQSESGQGFIQELKNATSTERAKKFTDYLRAGVASGMLSSDQARKFADVMGVAVGDSLMSTLAKKGLLGIDGAGSKSYLELSRQRKEALPRADVDALKTAIDKALAGRQLPKSFPVPGGKAGAGVGIGIQVQNQRQTIDPLLAASAVGSSLQIIQDYSNTVQLAREDLDAGKITQKEYSAIVKESMENQKIYSQTISDAITYSRDQGPTLQAIEEQFKSLGMTAEEIGKFADSVSGVGKEDIGKYYAEAAAAAVQGMLPSDIQAITDYALGEGKGGTAARTLTNQKYAGQGYGLSALAMSVEQGGILGLDKEQSQQTVDVAFRFTEQGGTVAEYQQFLMTLPKNKIVTIQTKLEGMSAPDLYKFTKGFNDIGAKGGIDLAVNVMFDENGNPVTGKELSETVKKTEAALNKMGSSKKKVKKEGSIELLTQIRGADGEQLSRQEAEGQWDSLVKQFGQQKILNLPTDILTKVLQYDLQIDDNSKRLLELENMLKTASATEKPEILRRIAAAQLQGGVLKDAQSKLVFSNQPPRTPDGDDDKKGGGGAKDNPLLNLKKSILEQIKMYVDINATMKKLNDQKYKFANIMMGSQGVFDKLKSIKGIAGGFGANGLGSAAREAIMGMGPDAAKKWIEKNTTKNKKGQTVLTKKGQEEANRLQAVSIKGTMVENVNAFESSRAQGRAAVNLRRKGVNDSVVQSIAGDPEKAKQLDFLQQQVNNKVKGSKKLYWEFVNEEKAAVEQAELLARAQDPIQTKIDDMTLAHKITTSEIDKQVTIYQDQLDLINKEIEAIQELNDDDQNRIRNLDRQKEMINRDIEALNRKNELDQRSADALKREDEIRNRIADGLSHELDLMSEQETKIQDAYDKRVKALDEVAKINDYIINQQKSQLGLAQALSQGDVYAAAAAQQDMQAGTAQFAQEQMRSGLQTGMENQVAGLTTAGGLTRDQAEAQINTIKQQSYQTSLQIRDIEDAIYNRNLEMIPLKDRQLALDDQIRVIQDLIYGRETDIINIQDGKLTAAQSLLDKQVEIKRQLDKNFEQSVSDLELQNDLRKMSDAQANSVNALAMEYGQVANQLMRINNIAANKLQTLGGEPTKTVTETSADFEKRLKTWRDSVTTIETERTAASSAAVPAPIAAPVAAAAAAGNFYGGIATFATGGVVGQGGGDSVPSMLTPGEYVMRKASVQKYGMPMLSKMNMGAFDMPRYDTQQPNITSVQPTSNTANINAPVYNTYSVNVSANTNASADDIANTVMTKIKRVDSMAVRSFRGY